MPRPDYDRTTDKCVTCKFFDPLKGREDGYCVLLPGTVILVDGNINSFQVPKKPTGTCGQHEAEVIQFKGGKP